MGLKWAVAVGAWRCSRCSCLPAPLRDDRSIEWRRCRPVPERTEEQGRVGRSTYRSRRLPARTSSGSAGVLKTSPLHGLLVQLQPQSTRGRRMRSSFIGPACFAFAVLVAGSSASAQNKVFTLQELYGLCTSPDPQKQGACVGFVTGVRHTLDTFKASLKDRVRYCIPATVNNREFKDGFVAWAERHRDKFAVAAVRAVIASAHDRYPCPGSAPRTFEF